jgi:NhaP-type Na+/H+ or K+/H+ antiporter
VTDQLALVFGLVLLGVVLLSERARQTVLSSAVVVLATGLLVGRGGLGWISLTPSSDALGTFAETALYSVLFVDGARLDLRATRKSWTLPGRALLIGLPLSVLGLAVAGHWVLQLPWLQALLVAAILSPTDPVFASVLLEQETVPSRLRMLLSVESGLNDGLALPLVFVLLDALSGERSEWGRLTIEVLGGAAIGVALPWAFCLLEKREIFAIADSYRPLVGIGLAFTLFGTCKVAGLNEFLAAFAGGMTFNLLQSEHAGAFLRFGEPLAESAKLMAVLAFGAALSLDIALQAGSRTIPFVLLALIVVRPVALLGALVQRGLSLQQWTAAAWFGPKGFASLFYAILMLHANVPNAESMFGIIAVVTVTSIVAHSSTDVLVARWLAREPQEG